MTVHLTPEQRDTLLRLVDAEIRELGPEIHHTRTYKDDLKERKRWLQALYDLLANAGSESHEAAAGLSGEPIGVA